MTLNSSKVTTIVGAARFEAEGPAEVVLSQYLQFLKSLNIKPASAPETGPLTPAGTMMQRFFIVGVPAKPHPAQPPAVRFVNRFGPACTTSP
jgi:hypothetical protein